jgi:hypothetical protein
MTTTPPTASILTFVSTPIYLLYWKYTTNFKDSEVFFILYLNENLGAPQQVVSLPVSQRVEEIASHAVTSSGKNVVPPTSQ